LNQNRALMFCFDAFSLREPVSTSLENALRLVLAYHQHVKRQHRRQAEQYGPYPERRHQKNIVDPLGAFGIQIFAANGLSGHCFPRLFVDWGKQ
jgi:uncharacterized membrane protein